MPTLMAFVLKNMLKNLQKKKSIRMLLQPSKELTNFLASPVKMDDENKETVTSDLLEPSTGGMEMTKKTWVLYWPL